MNREKTGSSRSRLYVAALVILVPAAALAVLQYRALAELKSGTAVTIRQALRQTIRAYSELVLHETAEISSRALEDLAATDLHSGSREAVLAGLERHLAAHPEIDQAGLARLCECPEAFAAVTSRGEVSWLTGEAASAWPLHPFLEQARPGLGEDDRRALRYFQAEREETAGERLDSEGLYAFGRFEGMIAAVRIRRSTLRRLVEEVIGRDLREDAAPGAPRFSLVTTRDDERFDEADYEVGAPLARPLGMWALAAGYPGRSIKDVAHENFLYNLAMMGVVLAALAFGVALSLRAVARQAKLAEMKSSFVSNVSHEMRTPLALISLFAETLKMERLDSPDKVREYHDVIHRESKRLTEMVNNVLDFSRMESGRRRYQLAPCDVEEVVREVVDGYRDPILAGGFELIVDIAPNLPGIRADRNALSQAIVNLLDNAVKYSQDEKRIAVRVFEREGVVAIEVEDSGVGIPAGELPRVFEKFHRTGNPLTATTRGSGLGLTLTKQAVEAHGGRIEASSRVGIGSRFTIVLPIANREPEPSRGGELAVPSLGR